MAVWLLYLTSDAVYQSAKYIYVCRFVHTVRKQYTLYGTPLCYTIALFEWQILIIRPLLSSPHNTTTRLIWFNYLNKSKWILKYFLRQIVNSLSIMKSLPVNRVDSYIIQWCCCLADSYACSMLMEYAMIAYVCTTLILFCS